ncbi:MAG: UDP-N-acetylgalactosamine-undecaprenyl-phosphate N-acetylgalactosaminephosphotransferase [uncultured Sphingomonas sp.]|uniref:UDP-N-acetylgalactosamine-undecaprenyl-phosphate N-acetylgalactosaminephosphotransferase n=1 Tax=uncultured Sphingomonas sp. TaxID=158754 RepID=A0A6J4SPB7_9SPHN|nr:MAG: UDP-N-acetylgalactosamine-undecaprenyl-phosphate N-acetylgalactosaminephosphotransferase [uncultured Sphingomonas sp.]
MRHDRLPRVRNRSLLTRKRFVFAGALATGALLPWALRGPLPGRLLEAASTNALWANAIAIGIAFWMRLSIETYPGIRRSYVILPSALTGHGLTLVWFTMTRLPYDRLALTLGFLFHVVWLYLLYVYAERRVRRRIAVVPYGETAALTAIEEVDWLTLSRPQLHDARRCDAIVADFSADLPDEWEAFLADAALAGRIVYQVKQLSESLSGRVELEHLSENSFGSLLPARGYFYLKAAGDFLFAVAILPFVLPLMAGIALAIRADSPGTILFRQKRVGHAGKLITVYKFRTMREVTVENARVAAMTSDDDDRITRVGGTLRMLRLDELPQILNILKWEMSWIGPRPEAEVLSIWYTSEIPFYRYRHVVKPGISGWAQVNQGHVAQVDEVHRKLQYDFYYIKYFSPWLDLLILLRTIKTMLNGFGAR